MMEKTQAYDLRQTRAQATATGAFTRTASAVFQRLDEVRLRRMKRRRKANSPQSPRVSNNSIPTPTRAAGCGSSRR